VQRLILLKKETGKFISEKALNMKSSAVTLKTGETTLLMLFFLNLNRGKNVVLQMMDILAVNLG